jgi:predicted acylesterase/phospholipase RssA
MKDNTIYVGLTLAGAVSAGAYTAGVMDYLIEALEEWEKRKRENLPNTPQHRVEIPVIGGSSAGGMTGIITAAALQDEITPVEKRPENEDELTGNRFYDSWVHLTGGDMFKKLLGNSDLEKGSVESIFNTEFIDEISKRAIKTSGNTPMSRPYISDNLKVFVTMSNLEGFEYDLGFKSEAKDSDEYIVKRHNDFACFVLNDGKYDKKNHPGWIPLNFNKNTNTDLARQTAIATGAFPIGLKARFIKRQTEHILDNPWLRVDNKKPNIKNEVEREDLMVDGGMINNEPFAYVENVLKNLLGYDDKNYPDSFEEFKSTVLMIDPFPSELKEFEKDASIFKIAGKVLGTMLSQARTKPDGVISAFKEDSSSHFMIAPKRYFPRNTDKNAKEGAYAVACGFLGGFGGFINKDFRVHDYFLGRANCEQFLRHQFVVPVSAKNPIIEEGYKNVDNKASFQTTDEKGTYYQIIPLFSEKKDKAYLPDFNNGDWPIKSEDDVKKYKKPLKRRVSAILSTTQTKKWFLDKMLIPFASFLFLKRTAANKFIDKVEEEMKLHKLWKG